MRREPFGFLAARITNVQLAASRFRRWPASAIRAGLHSTPAGLGGAVEMLGGRGRPSPKCRTRGEPVRPGPAGLGASTGTVAFLFTDIEGSTQRWETHREAMDDAVKRHDALLYAMRSISITVMCSRPSGRCVISCLCARLRCRASAFDAQRTLSAEDFSSV